MESGVVQKILSESPLAFGGSWCGFSRFKLGGATTQWTDLHLTDLPTSMSMKRADGQGISVWRGKEIPFTLHVSLTSCEKSGVPTSARLTKVHTSRAYSNSNEYICNVGYCPPEALHAFLSNGDTFEFSNPGFMLYTKNLGQEEEEDDGTAKTGMASYFRRESPNVIFKKEDGSGGGMVKLVRVDTPIMRELWNSWLAVQRSRWSSSPSPSLSLSLSSLPREPACLLESRPTAAILSTSASTAAAAAAAAATHSSPKENISPPPAPFAASSTALDTSIPERDICKLCYNAPIDAVILPCGHFALCYACGINLDECPFDRVAIDKLQLIYRV